MDWTWPAVTGCPSAVRNYFEDFLPMQKALQGFFLIPVLGLNPPIRMPPPQLVYPGTVSQDTHGGGASVPWDASQDILRTHHHPGRCNRCPQNQSKSSKTRQNCLFSVICARFIDIFSLFVGVWGLFVQVYMWALYCNFSHFLVKFSHKFYGRS